MIVRVVRANDCLNQMRSIGLFRRSVRVNSQAGDMLIVVGVARDEPLPRRQSDRCDQHVHHSGESAKSAQMHEDAGVQARGSRVELEDSQLSQYPVEFGALAGGIGGGLEANEQFSNVESRHRMRAIMFKPL